MARGPTALTIGVVLVVASGSSASAQPDGPGSSGPVRSASSSTPRLVWVALEGAGELAKVDVIAREVVRRVTTGGGPHNLTVNGAGTVAATLYASDKVAMVRRGRLRKVRLGGRPHDVKAYSGGFVVANEDGHKVQFLGPAGGRKGRVLLPAPPHDLAVQKGAGKAWVSLDGDDRLAVVDLETRAVRYVATGHRPHDLLFAPDGRLFVTDWTGRLLVLSPTGVVKRVRKLGQEAHHLAFTPDGRRVWITDHDAHRVFVLATGTLKILKSIRFPGAPHHVAVTPDGRLAVVANHTGGTMVVYRASTMRRIAAIAVGGGPHGVWAVPPG